MVAGHSPSQQVRHSCSFMTHQPGDVNSSSFARSIHPAVRWCGLGQRCAWPRVRSPRSAHATARGSALSFAARVEGASPLISRGSGCSCSDDSRGSRLLLFGKAPSTGAGCASGKGYPSFCAKRRNPQQQGTLSQRERLNRAEHSSRTSINTTRAAKPLLQPYSMNSPFSATRLAQPTSFTEGLPVSHPCASMQVPARRHP